MSYPAAAGANPAATMSQHLDVLMMPLRYVDKLRAKSDIMNLLAQSRSLAPKVAQHVHNNGQTETLLSLTGTIPIWFQTVQYNIPVTIWVPEQYPHRPPFPYVTPTRDMCIKDRHKHVDLHGLVYLPYLNQWSTQSTLAELVIIMSSVFSEEPPVFRKPAVDPQPQPLYHPPPATQPLAHQPQPPQPQPQPPSQSQSQSQPQIQPRPFLPPIQQQPVQSPSPQSNSLVNNTNNLQLPAHILEQQRILERIQRERAGANSTPVSSSSSSSSSSVSPNSVYDPSPAYQPPSSSSSSSSASSSSSREASPPSVSSISSSSSSSAASANSRGVRKQQLVQSVTSSVRQHLTKIHTDLASHYDKVATMQQEMNSQHSQLKAELVSLETQHATLSTALKQLQEANEKSKEWLERNEALQIPPIDKLVYPKDTWSKQLLESVCEDGAIEDTLYCLDRGLEDDRIDIANFLKLTRSLARRQFHVRALALKLQAKLQEQNGPGQVPIPSNAFAAPSMVMTVPNSSSSSYSSMLPNSSSSGGMIHTMQPSSNAAVVVGSMRY